MPGARLALTAVCLLVAALMPVPAAAGDDKQQAAGSGQSTTQSRRPDFLFGAPSGSLGIRGSWLFASAGSDVFDFVTRQLTLDKGDFNSPGFVADVSVRLTPRLDIQGGFAYDKMSAPSEYRDFVDNNLLPIEQTTSLKMLHLTGSLRYALTPRGHDVSRFAWVPRRVVPYVGAGAGIIRYEFLQRGDFVDFQDRSVFSDVFRSTAWTPSGHAFAGVDLHIYRALYTTIEGRYTKAAGTLSSDFVDFDPIDLSGFRISAGLNVLF